MCQAPVGRVIEVSKGSVTIEYNGTKRVLDSRLVEVQKGDYVTFSLNMVVDKIEKEEAEAMTNGME